MIDMRAELESLPKTIDEELEALYLQHASECADLNKQIIKKGLNSGTDIHGDPFRPLEPSTEKSRRSHGYSTSPPLKASGDLYRGIRKRGQFVFDTARSKKGEFYGTFHNEGFTHHISGKPVPDTAPFKREFFGTPDDFFESAEYKVLDKKLQKATDALLKSRKKKKRI